MPSAVPTIPVSARNCSGTLCGCRTSSWTSRYMRCVTGNEPAPQPPTGLSVHAPAASFHHTQRLPEFDEMIRFGSESLSWLVFVNSCHASSKNCPGPPFDVAIPSTTISANTPTVAPRPRHTSCVLSLAPLRALLEAQHPPRRDQQPEEAAGHDEAQDDPVRRALVERDVDPLQRRPAERQREHRDQRDDRRAEHREPAQPLPAEQRHDEDRGHAARRGRRASTSSRGTSAARTAR